MHNFLPKETENSILDPYVKFITELFINYQFISI